MIRVDQVVKVALSEIIDRDIESFNDLLDALTDNAAEEPGLLEDIVFDVVGLGDEPNTLMIRVQGQRRET